MNIEPADVRDTVVDNEQLAVAPPVVAQRFAPTPAMEPSQMHAVIAQVSLQRRRRAAPGTCRVQMHLDVDARSSAFRQRLGKPPADFVAGKDVALHAHDDGGAVDRREHRFVQCVAFREKLIDLTQPSLGSEAADSRFRASIYRVGHHYYDRS